MVGPIALVAFPRPTIELAEVITPLALIPPGEYMATPSALSLCVTAVIVLGIMPIAAEPTAKIGRARVGKEC
jgi:hypothetical protein